MSAPDNFAPGWPGVEPRWTSSAKTGVGSSISSRSNVWFTLSHGIFNEIYYPREDVACTRDMGLIVTDGKSLFSEEKRDADSEVIYLAEGVPAYRLVNKSRWGRYRIEKEVIADPQRDVVLQRTRFVPLHEDRTYFHVYVVLAPHLGNHGSGNTGWVGDYKGVPMLFAERTGFSLALACSAPWVKRSVGFVGVSDGWQDLSQHKEMTWKYTRAENGNIALTGEIGIDQGQESFVLALGFGPDPAEAGFRALASLLQGFDSALDEYVREWQAWQVPVLGFEGESGENHSLYRKSLAVLRTHETKSFPGGVIASLSIPWGFSKGDNDLGGYHLVWPRDQVEAAGGMLAARAHDAARRVGKYLHVTQENDGHWPQNMWLNGTPYWTGTQMDETAMPILLVSQAHREGALKASDLESLWPMIRRAAGFIARNGPVTQEDRWEESGGYSPYTLATEVAALLAAADLAELNDDLTAAGYMRQTADVWNDSIERWTYVTGTDLAEQHGVQGYYVRIAPPDVSEDQGVMKGYIPVKHRRFAQALGPTSHVVSPDALSLVRFGLRAPNDPRIIDTVKVIDALLKVETPGGPCWRRYNGDVYGEHEDGSPYDGTGIGRAWPLLTGERAHYELAAGRLDEAKRLKAAMEHFAGEGGMIPEQIWDANDIPERGLYFGKPAGSAMPLVWAHAEYVKLCRSLLDGTVFDMPPQPVQRYLVQKTGSPYRVWRFNNKCRQIPTGKTLRLEVMAPAIVHWSFDGWKTAHDTDTRPTGFEIHVADLDTASLSDNRTVDFTFYWQQARHWEGQNFSVKMLGKDRVG